MTPVFKWLLALLALLPMSLYVNSSLSGDIVNNATCFLFIGYVFNIAFGLNSITRRQLTVLIILSALVASLKMVYAPILLLLLLIPRRHFASQKSYWGSAAIILAVAAFCAGLSYFTINELYIPYADYAPEAGWVHLAEGADKDRQMQHLLQNPQHIFTVILKTITHTAWMYLPGYIGTFGWLEASLPIGIIVFAYLLLVFTAFAESGKAKLTFYHRIIFFSAFFLMFSLVILSQHLNWDVVGTDYVVTMQGRYLTPIFPLLFMLFYNRKFDGGFILRILVPLGSILLVVYSLAEIYVRFYH